MRRNLTAVWVGLIAAGIAGAAAAEPLTHYTVNDDKSGVVLPRKVLLLPLDITVYRVGAGGVTERAEDLTTSEIKDTEQALQGDIAGSKQLELVPIPKLDGAAQATLDEHIALYEQVANAALRHGRGYGGWSHKASHFDYTVGNGLRFLKQRTGADAALIVLGQGGVPTASSYIAGLLPLLAGVVVVPQARGIAIVGVVDLSTGNILWLDQVLLPGSVTNAVGRVLSAYPDPTGPKVSK